MTDQARTDTDAMGSGGGEARSVADVQRRFASWLPLGLAVVVLLALMYGPILAWMFQRWLHDPFYGHAFLVPAISAVLIWRQRQRLRASAANGSVWGLAALSAATALALGGKVLQIHFLEALSLVPMLWGIAAWVWGARVGRALAFPIGFLVFMVPLSRMLVEFVAFPMQLGSAGIAGALLNGFGVPVFVAGVDLHVPDFSFEIDIPCSGLQSVISMTAIAALFAYVVRGKPWARATVFALSIPVALAANVGRIIVVVLLAMCVGGDVAMGFFHGVSSILVFVLAAIGLIGAGRLLGCTAIREDL